MNMGSVWAPFGAFRVPGHGSGGFTCSKGLFPFREVFHVKRVPRSWFFRILGSVWVVFWLPFGDPQALVALEQSGSILGAMLGATWCQTAFQNRCKNR